VTSIEDDKTMKTHSAENERIKRQSEPTVDAVAKSLARFEEYNKAKDFKLFNHQQAVAFKNHLAEQNGKRSGEKLSKATLHATLANLKRFFLWLAGQPSYKSRFQYSDADYFNLSEKDVRVATAKREQKVPTLEQVKHVIANMPTDTEIALRNKAVVAFTLLTGARDSAIASMKLKHIDLVMGSVYQDARDVRTKFSKTFTTYFSPVGDDIKVIVEDWVNYLRADDRGRLLRDWVMCKKLRE
jgi:integrase/recombinase XerD